MTRFMLLGGLACMGHAAGNPRPAAQAAKAHAAPPKAVKVVVAANGDFAFDLYHALAEENQGKNLFFSPYSVSVALTLATEGARGETAEQMGRALRYPAEAKGTGEGPGARPWRMEVIHKGMSALQDRFNARMDLTPLAETDAEVARLREEIKAAKKSRWDAPGPLSPDQEAKRNRAAMEREKALVARLDGLLEKTRRYELKTANALWAEKGYPFEPEFFATIGKYYGTGTAFPANFEDSAAAERLRINAWVEDRTERRIKDLVPDGGVDEHTRLVLVNAIYFKGGWSTPFKDPGTKVRKFTLADGGSAEVPTMHAPRLDSARYAAFQADGSFFNTPWRVACGDGGKEGAYPDSGGFSMVELDYKGRELSMVILVPNHPALLAELERKLSRENLSAWLERLQSRPVEVFLPKYRVETTYILGEPDRPKALQKLGMKRAFMDPRAPGGAQFEGMSKAVDPGEKLRISLVIHKAFVEVDEKGTEAAAATAVIMSRVASGRSGCDFTPRVRADRPFVYLIRDRATGSVLFLGRMMNPG